MIEEVCKVVFELLWSQLSQSHFGLSVRMKLTLPKVGTWSPLGLPKTQSLIAGVKTPCIGGFLYSVRKVLKCRCPKWLRMSHLDICSPSYGQKKGRESNWQFDSRPLKVRNRPLLTFAEGVRYGIRKLSRRATTLVETSLPSKVRAMRYEFPKSRESNPGQFRDSSLGVLGKSAIRM